MSLLSFHLSTSQLRALVALQYGPQTREQIDKITRTSNGPNIIFRLRGMGFELPCSRISFVSIDGHVAQCGLYSMTNNDKILFSEYLQKINVRRGGA